MEEKEFLDEVYENTSKDVETEVEKALTCYIELGKRTNYMSAFFFGNEYDQYNLYASKKFIMEGDRNIAVCNKICEQYGNLISRFGINYEIVVDTRDMFAGNKETPHVYTVINLKDGNKLKVDLTKDLYRLNIGNVIRHFGSNPVNEKNPYVTFDIIQIQNLCTKVGYVKDASKFMNDKWKAVGNFVENNSFDLDKHEKLEFILNTTMNFNKFPNLGPVERVCFYNSFFNNLKIEEHNKGNMETPLEEDVKRTYFKEKFIPTGDPVMPYTINKNNDAYNILFSIKDRKDEAHHFIQKKGKLIHLDNLKLKEYINNNNIEVTSNSIPFLENDKQR